MATVEVTAATFPDVVESNDIVLLDFWADWCQPCHEFAPIYEAVSDRHPDVLFAKVDAEADPEIARQFNVKSIPTLAAIRDKIVVFSEAGIIPDEGIEELLRQIRGLDMAAVRAEIAQHEGESDGSNGE